MDNYKKALDKAIECIMNNDIYYCDLCVNATTCDKQYMELEKQGIQYKPDERICKDSVRQYFLRAAEGNNDNEQ